MSRCFFAAGFLSLMMSAGVLAAPPEPSEAALRQQVEHATWPADIVRAADDYLQRFPRSAFASQAQAARTRAADAARVLSNNDVRLYRSAFESREADASASADMRRAALGDKDAAMRLARASQRTGSYSPETNHYLGWLQYASMLGSDRASYELAVYYRKQDQPALAARYEARAMELGFEPPRSLDHVRK